MAINVWRVTGQLTELQTATASQTLFNLLDFTFIKDTGLSVYINGVKQVKATSYVETSSSSITFVAALESGDLVEFVY